MYHPRLYGEYYEMGLKYGKLLYEKAGFTIPEISKEKHNFGIKSFSILKDFYPEVVEEIKGFAKGIKDKPENLAAFILSIGVLDTNGQCSVFAFKNNDSVIIGRNYDMFFEFKKFTESSLIVPKDKFASISQSDIFIGRVDGINEKGLSIAMSFVNGKTIQPGINFYFIVRKVLEECSTTQEAIDLILPIRVSSANNFIIADKSGDIVVVESSPVTKHIRRPKENYIYITNQFVSQEMKTIDIGGTEWSKSAERYSGFEQKLKSVKVMNLRKAKEILSDNCICLDLKKEKFGTIWSIVANLNDLKIERAETKPKPTNYKHEKRLDWWINKKKK